MPANNVVPFAPRDRHTVTADPSATVAAASPIPIETAVYTVRETAHMLSLSLGSTYSLIRNGEIPARKMGGRWVVPKQRFHTWLNELPEATDADFEREFARTARRSS